MRQYFKIIFIYVCALLRNNFLTAFHKAVGRCHNWANTRNWILKSYCTGIRRYMMIIEVSKNPWYCGGATFDEEKKFSNISGFQLPGMIHCV